MKYLYLIIVLLFLVYPLFSQSNRIAVRGGEKEVFASGVNVAWGINADGSHNFAKDVIALPDYSFPKILDEIQATGGNAMRWWLHTNGLYSPDFNSEGQVTGISSQTIPIMKKVLDMAYERGIVVSMCLWSFDMLQPQGQNQALMKQLIEDSTYTNTYIKNALIPILKEIGNHPAVMCWEVFNEPEGMTNEFGWTPVKTDMKFVQQFVNLIAGAIHRNAPGALVSNGSWSFKALTDVGGNFNYYSDERLIAAGKDSQGTLDFYQVHYYPEHFGNDLSPFHHPASYWGLNKPIVVGEFPIKGIDQKANPYLTTKEAYLYAYDNGYAGCMAWSWTDNNQSLSPASDGMIDLWQNHKADVEILPDPNFNFAPKVVQVIPDIKTLLGSEDLKGYVDLHQIFLDEKDGNNLTYTLENSSNAALATIDVDNEGKVNIQYSNATGKTIVTVKATDSGGKSSSTFFSIAVRDAAGNLALFKKTTASSMEGTGLESDNVTDGDPDTRWSSAYNDAEWIYIDLESVQKFDKVVLNWEAAYGKEYILQTSDDASNWQTVKAVTSGGVGKTELKFTPVEARYVKMTGFKRGTDWGYSLYEFEVYLTTVTGIDQKVNKLFKIYPNPTHKNIILESQDSFSQTLIKVKDIQGQLMLEKQSVSSDLHRQQLEMETWPEGIYIIEVQTRGGVFARKVIKI